MIMTPNRDVTLSPFRFVALEQLAWIGVEHVAQDVERSEVDALHRAGNEALRCGDRDRSTTRLRERISPFQAAAVHEFGQAKAHVQHATKVYTEAGRSNTGYLPTATLVRVLASRYNTRMAPDEEVAAIDAANEHTPLCILCRASFAHGITALCASCLYDSDDHDGPQSTTSEAHAA